MKEALIAAIMGGLVWLLIVISFVGTEYKSIKQNERLTENLRLKHKTPEASEIDRGRCLNQQSKLVLIPLIVGKVIMMQQHNISICQEWEFPHGKSNPEEMEH